MPRACVYFPRDVRINVSERDAEIYRRYMANELSIPEIAQEYRMSLQWAYAIIRKVRDNLRKAREVARTRN